MSYVIKEMTKEEAIKMLKKAKGKTVLVAIQDLEHNKFGPFRLNHKTECESMITEAKTIFSNHDDFVKMLNLFTEQQKDLMNITPHGFRKIILLKE